MAVKLTHDRFMSAFLELAVDAVIDFDVLSAVAQRSTAEASPLTADVSTSGRPESGHPLVRARLPGERLSWLLQFVATKRSSSDPADANDGV
jgi:hypothetical protein